MILLLLLLIVGCSQKLDFVEKSSPHISKSSNPVFNSYILQFKRNMRVHSAIAPVITTPINFGKLKSPNVGVCYYFKGSQHTEIEIDKKKWLTFTELQKQTLIDHELGHCVLKKDHNDKEADCPDSIMRSYMFNVDEIERCYIPKNEEYYKELFNTKGKKL